MIEFNIFKNDGKETPQELIHDEYTTRIYVCELCGKNKEKLAWFGENCVPDYDTFIYIICKECIDTVAKDERWS